MKKLTRPTLHLVVLFFGTIVALSRILFFTNMNGFDYSVFQPDGFCYTYNSIKVFEDDLKTISSVMSEKYPNSSSRLDQNTCATLSGRLLYPLLSAPFVKYLGSHGMLVVPMFSYLTFLSLLIFGLRQMKIHIAIRLLVLSLVLCSTTLSRWYISNLTDPLLYLGSSLLLYIVLFKNWHSKKNLLALIVIIILMALTKRSLHIALIIGILLIFQTFREGLKSREFSKLNIREVLNLLTVFFAIPYLCDFLVSEIFPAQNTLALTRLIEVTPASSLAIEVAKNILASIGQVFVMDWPLALLLICWLTCITRRSNFLDPLNLLGVLGPIAIFFVTASHLNPGLNLRFEINFMLVMVLYVANQLNAWLFPPNSSN
jgi:hypothetical protein